MKNLSGIFLILIMIFVCFGFGLGCGTDGSAPYVTTTSISTAFPLGLAFSSPTQKTTSSDAIKKQSKQNNQNNQKNKKGKPIVATDITSSSTYATKVAAITDMVNGTTVAACDFNLTISTSTDNATCYGPIVYYNNQHPDGAGAAGNFPPGDNGIWTSTEGTTTEACSAAQLTKKVQGVSSLVDSMIMSTASMFCIAKVYGKTLPTEGTTLTLTTEVAAAYVTNDVGLVVTSATIERSANDSSGNPIYITTIAGTTTSGSDVTVRLKHIPTSTDNSSYKGKLSWKIGSSVQNSNCGQSDYNSEGQTYAGSIAYEKPSSTNIRYKLMSAQFCGNTSHASPFVSSTNWSVDPTKGFTDGSIEGGWAGNFNYAVFSFNPSNSIGEYQYAWQAGYMDGATRVFNVALTSDTTVTTTTNGTAYFGFGPSINANTNLGTISGMYCNWAGPNGKLSGAAIQALAQKQTISKTSSATQFSVVTDNIAYAPVNSCSTSSAQFQYGLTESYGTTGPASHSLVASTTITGVSPTPAVDVEL
ncbi:MAG: hypothetical protein HQK49_20230 [Oligoflexia bacterium]|nr:hypothetical protein [Oligoflexia bacterium]